MTDLKKLNQLLLQPCKRDTWSFDGEVFAVELTAQDLVEERTWRSLNVVENFNAYEPEIFRGFLVHNPEVRKLLDNAHTREGLEALRDAATAHGVFEPEFDGALVVTSTAPENINMNVNRWITDSVHNLALVEDAEKRAAIIRLLAKFYCTSDEQMAFRYVIKYPEHYRDEHDSKTGVAHLFRITYMDGETLLKRDETWNNNKRLESHGLALRTFCDFLLTSSAAQTSEEDVCKAIASLGLYFQAIEYPTAPSAGAWEEVPLPGGLSWDTEAIRQGFVKLKELMFGSSSGKDAYRQRIAWHANHLASVTGCAGIDTLFTDEKATDEQINIGTDQVRLRILQKAEAPGMRSRDSSLSFLAQSDLELVTEGSAFERVTGTVKHYIALLEYLEAGIVRQNGMIRYEPSSLQPGQERLLFDSYLTVNYWLGFDEEGYFNPTKTRLVKAFESMDTSEAEAFTKRMRLGVPNREAEWFTVSEIARAYAKQVHRLKSLLSENLSSDERKEVESLIVLCKEKAIEFVMRGYARITPDVSTKSNGEPCPAWSLPEAYEWVRIRSRAVGRGADGFSERVLAGPNTTLAWAASSLKRATQEVLEIL